MKKMVTSKGKMFVDAQGRHTLLHGINMVCKEKNRNYIGDYHDQDFKTLSKWGFNVIRLGIFWDGVEPRPGQYDEQYLSQIDRLIAMAAQYGISVFLDMHQDLFSNKFSDGAPDWATLTDGKEHIATDLWSESYLLSGAVQAAFDNFWGNKQAEDGIGIQDHYINMWRHIAARYRDNAAVIGYDVMNEPFMGSGANAVLQALLENLAQAIPGGQDMDMEALLAAWTNPYQKEEVVQLLTDKTLYANLMQSVQALSQQFEKTSLHAFYSNISKAIRKVDPETMIFLETNYFSNAGMMSGVTPITDENGVRDPYQAYAPHGYDILVDTDMYDQSCNARVDVIFDAHKKVQDALDLPMIVGEWGCCPNATEKQLEQTAHLTRIFENALASDTYFDFSHIYNNLITKVIVRAYPMKAAGEILTYSYNYQCNTFYCEIKEDCASGSSVIFVPNLQIVGEISLEPYGQGYTVQKIEGGDSGCLIIPALGDQGIRRIRFAPSK